MALIQVGSGNGGGDFLPFIKYDARAGRFFRVDKDMNGSTPVDITRSFRAVFDLEQVEVGWMLFGNGVAPDYKLVPFGHPVPPKPTDKHKQGVRLRLKLSKECGGDVRELSQASGAFLRGINTMHDEYLKQAPANPGKLPVLVLRDTIPVESGSGAQRSTNYQPVFAIEGWAPRPADMPFEGDAGIPAPKTNGTSHPAPAGGTRVAPPAPPPPVSANDANRIANQDDFG